MDGGGRLISLVQGFFHFLDEILGLLWLPRWFRPSHLIYDVDFKGKRRRNISAYDAERTVFFSWLWLFSSTVLDSFAVLSTAVLCLLCYGVGYLRCPSQDPAPAGTAAAAAAAVAASASPRTAWCIPVPSETEFLTLSTLASFLCGFLLSLTMQRWWSVRTLIQGVIGRSNNLVMLIGSHVVGDDEALAHARREVVRLLNLAHALIYKQAYRQDDMTDLEERGLLLPEEHEHLRGMPSRATVAYGWIGHALRQIAAGGHLVFPEHTLPVLLNDLTLMRGSASDLFMYMATLLPYSYIHLVILVVRLHLMLLFMVCAGQVGRALDEGSKGGVVASLTAFTTNIIIYHAILRIHSMLADPIGDDPDDFPTHNYQRSLERSTNVLLDRMESPPSSIAGILQWAPSPPPAATDKYPSPLSVALAGPTPRQTEPAVAALGPGSPLTPPANPRPAGPALHGDSIPPGAHSAPRVSLRLPEKPLPTIPDGAPLNGRAHVAWPHAPSPDGEEGVGVSNQRRGSVRSDAGSEAGRGPSRAAGTLVRQPGAAVTRRRFEWEESHHEGPPAEEAVSPAATTAEGGDAASAARSRPVSSMSRKFKAMALAVQVPSTGWVAPSRPVTFRSSSSAGLVSPAGGAVGRAAVAKSLRVLDMS
eukprot:tig00021517_g22018.t1